MARALALIDAPSNLGHQDLQTPQVSRTGGADGSRDCAV
jgi:hypothetical protein